MTWGEGTKTINADGNVFRPFLDVSGSAFKSATVVSVLSTGMISGLTLKKPHSHLTVQKKKKKCVLWFIRRMLSCPRTPQIISDPVQKLYGKRKPRDEYDDIMVQKREGRPRWSKHVLQARTASEMYPPKSHDLAAGTVCNQNSAVALLKLEFLHRKRGRKLQDSS